MSNGQCLRIFEGHTHGISSVALSKNGNFGLSGSSDKSVRFWAMSTGRCLSILGDQADEVRSVQFRDNDRLALSAGVNGFVQEWNLANVAQKSNDVAPTVDYTNAKIVLVGDSGAGKTGIAQRLALNKWEKSDSTVGAWSTQWKLPQEAVQHGEREIWLWDFGGQADQRLIHQLYMDEAAVAVLVFDPQKENCMETLAQWDRDICKAARRSLRKLIVAGRTDTGRLRMSRELVTSFVREHGFSDYLETSAKEDIGCGALKAAIIENIRWDEIPWHSSPVLFKRLKEAIIQLKDQGVVLLRYSELRQRLELTLGTDFRFKDDELRGGSRSLGGSWGGM
jgi:small GTP-binding protein